MVTSEDTSGRKSLDSKAYSQGLFSGPILWGKKIIVSLSPVAIDNGREYLGHTLIPLKRY